jgi:hypothetical protein
MWCENASSPSATGTRVFTNLKMLWLRIKHTPETLPYHYARLGKNSPLPKGLQHHGQGKMTKAAPIKGGFPRNF